MYKNHATSRLTCQFILPSWSYRGTTLLSDETPLHRPDNKQYLYPQTLLISIILPQSVVCFLCIILMHFFVTLDLYPLLRLKPAIIVYYDEGTYIVNDMRAT